MRIPKQPAKMLMLALLVSFIAASVSAMEPTVEVNPSGNAPASVFLSGNKPVNEALFDACKLGMEDIVAQLVNRPEGSGRPDKCGIIKVFYIAGLTGDVKIINMLLNASDASIRPEQSNINEGFRIACEVGNIDVVNTFLNRSEGSGRPELSSINEAFRCACLSGQDEIVALIRRLT